MRNIKAFTIIELLVVISIIMLLMAILLPVAQQVRNQARAVVCQANLRQWGTIFHMYTEENNGRFLTNQGQGMLFLSSAYLCKNYSNNISDIYNYSNTKDILFCPMAVRVGPGGEYFSGSDPNQVAGRAGSTFEAWETISITQSQPFCGSYGYNGWLFSPLGGDIKSMDTWVGYEVSSVKCKFNVPVFLDCVMPLSHLSIPPLTEKKSFSSGFCINRHNGFVNGLFLDWSVRKVGLKELWTLKWHEDYNTVGPWTKAGGVKPEDWPDWMQGFKDY